MNKAVALKYSFECYNLKLQQVQKIPKQNIEQLIN